jgi:glutamyl-tRNA synthetase
MQDSCAAAWRKKQHVLWPLRVAVSGKPSTPGGGTELCAILGKAESVSRIRQGIALLEKDLPG